MKKEGFRDPAIEKQWARKMAGKVAFLRHKTPWFKHRESSDWDLAVKDPEDAGEAARELLGIPLLTVQRPYVEQRFYEWGELDFLPSFQWNGFIFLEAKRFWGRVGPGKDGLPRPCLAHDAFLVWMTGLLGGKSFNPRYEQFLMEAWRLEGRELQECLSWAFGEEWAADLGDLLTQGRPGQAVVHASDLRSVLALRSFCRAPMATVELVLRHWSTELVHHWKPPFPWVAFLGPDGAGKSTVIQGLQDRLSAFRLKTLLVHWRPKWAGFEPPDAMPVRAPHDRKPRGRILSAFSLVLLALRWLGGRIGRTWHQRAKQKMLISDRYYPDLLVDPKRYRFGGSPGLAWFIFRFLPRPDLTLILLTSPAVILARKQEVAPAELERQLVEYRRLAGLLPNDAIVVDVGKSEEEVLDEVYHLLVSRVFGRSSERERGPNKSVMAGAVTAAVEKR